MNFIRNFNAFLQVNQICELAKSEVRITVEYHIADDFSPPNCNATCVRKELSQILTTLKKRIGPEWNVLKSADAGISSRYKTCKQFPSLNTSITYIQLHINVSIYSSN